jgi:hypothetical protein
MPLQKLALKPGVNRESTSYANEGGYYSSNKIRFRSGQPEKIGGWVADTGTNTAQSLPPTGTLWGVCRSLWNWINLAGSNLLALGTNLKYYIQSGVNGFYYDVTPLRNPSGTTVGSNAFTTTSTSTVGYTTVICNATAHGCQTGDFVTITNVASAVNGIPAASLNSQFQVTYIDTGRFSIQVYVTSSVTTGTTGAATFYYQIAGGSDIYTQNLGWGAGGWGGATGPAAATVLSSSLPIIGMTVLAGDLSAAATTVTVASTSTLAVSGSLLIDSEIISYTGRTATTLTGCTRGASSTTAATHLSTTGVIQYASVTISVSDSTSFSAPGTAYVDGEAFSFSGKGSGTLTGCVRGTNGYVTSHASLASVYQYGSTATGWGASAPAGLGVAQQLRLWSQTNFGEDLIFNPRGGPMYYWANSTSLTTFNPGQLMGPSSTITLKSGATVTVDAYCPSVVNFVMVSDASRFVLAFGCNDSIGGTLVQDPLLIYWSDQESFAVWYPEVTNQAGSYRLSSGSQIITAIQTRQEILVLTDSAIYSMQYLGPPYVWGFQIMGDNISIAGPNAIATANNITYWMGTDKFYMYSGRVQTLPSTLREYVYTDINLTQSFQFMAGTNEGYNEVWWQYCSANSNVIDRYVIYNHLDDVWYYGDWSNYTGTAYQGRTAWRDSPLRAYPMAAAYGEAGGSSNALLVYHESGTDDGVVNPARPIVSQVTSSDFDIGDGHNFGFVWRLIPDLTFDGSYSAAPQAMFTVLPRANPGANYGPSNDPEVISAQNYQQTRTYAVQQFTQQVYVRIRGRQMAFQVSSGTVGSDTSGLGVQWQLGVPRIDIRPDGRR